MTEYEYTGVNQTKKKYSPNHYIEYMYDENGKVTEERVTKDGGASWQAITNVYDNANGNVTSTTRSGETLTFGYSGDKQLRDTVYIQGTCWA